MAEELQDSFPQFDIETIISVVKTEVTSEASAMKLVEIDDQRNRAIAEQYAKNIKRQEQLKQENNRYKLSKSKSIKKTTKADVELISRDVVRETPTKISTLGDVAEQLEQQPEHHLDNVIVEAPVAKQNTFLAPKKEAADSQMVASPSYSDLASPAVDLLLRGFGGREKHAPEKNTNLSLPSHAVEEKMKANIATNKDAPSLDLAGRKEARRKARRERRVRQQQEREAAAKLSNSDVTCQHSRPRRSGDRMGDATHLTNHSDKERLLPSQSAPSLKPSFTDNGNDKAKVATTTNDGKVTLSRQGASSGYDTGSEWQQEALHHNTDGNAVNDKCDNGPSLHDTSKSERKGGATYACGGPKSKYDSSTNRSAAKSKPNKYEARKAKRYSNRRKTLNYDHYNTEQDRTSL